MLSRPFFRTPSAPAHSLTRRRLLCVVGLGSVGLALSACSGDEPSEYTAFTLNAQGEKTDPDGSYRKLAEELNQLHKDTAGDDMSLSVYNYSDQTTFVFTPDYRGYEASTVKVPLALTAMRRAFADQKFLSDELRELVKASIGFSDNDATVQIFASLGDTDEARAAEMNKTYDLLDISQTRADAGWGANLTGTEDHLKIQRAVYEGVDWIAMEDMQILRDSMNATDPASQGWGVGVLAKLSGAGADSTELDAAQKVLCKNGWLPDDLGTWYINSDGAALMSGKTFALSVMVSGFKDQVEGQHAASRAVEAVMRNLAL